MTHKGSVVMVDNARTINGMAAGASTILAVSGTVAGVALDIPNDRLYALAINTMYQINKSAPGMEAAQRLRRQSRARAH